MQHHLDTETVALEHDVLVELGVGPKKGQIELLSLHLLTSQAENALLFLQLEEDLLFLDAKEHLRKVLRLKLVLESCLFMLDFEVTFDHFARFVLKDILEIGGASGGELGIPLELDLYLVFL